MKNIEKTYELLLQKKQLFSEYANQTTQLLNAEEDDVDNYITNRDNLAIKIDAISDEIKDILSNEPDTVLADVVFCKCNYENVPETHIEIYETAKQIFQIISQIKELNSQIEQNFTLKREQIKKRLIETKNTPQIARYLGALSNTPNEGAYTGSDKKV